MAEKIAIVIPAYNAEKSLPQTLESVLQQTHADVEAWVVDDGSTDSTAAVAERFAASDSRVRVIRQENAGAYMARLAALKRIDAPWFGFVDADDTIAPDMYEKMLAFADKERLEVVECDVAGAVKNGGAEELFPSADAVANMVRDVAAEGNGCFFVWNKLYRRRPIPLESSGIFMFDDLAFNLQYFLSVSRFGRLHEGLYHYNVNAGSSVRNFRRKNVDDFCEALRFRTKYLPAYGVAADDSAHVRWLKKNVRNMFVTACSAPCPDFATRMDNVRHLLETVGWRVPPCLAVCVLATGFAKRLQVALKRLLGRERWQ